MCRTLIVDNFDSFTYNLFQYMGEVCGEEPTVVVNTTPREAIDLGAYDCAIISPGPGTPANPADVGVSADLIREGALPILGVCLGHQSIGYLNGMEVGLAPKPMHGRVSVVRHDGHGIFASLPPSIPVVRYHSLVVREVRPPFVLSAWGDDGVIQGLRHRDRPLHGVQFHPESICTDFGKEMLRNFRDIALSYDRARRAA